MAAVGELFRKSCMLLTVSAKNTGCRRSVSDFYRKHTIENIAEKKRLLGLTDSPEIHEVINIEESTAEWKYVERLLPRLTVPIITNSANYPTFSGWKPPAETAPDVPYYVRRRRTQLLPIYFKLRNGQNRPITTVKFIEGDIWAFESDIRSYLEKITGQHVYTQVHEVANFIRFRGNHVNSVKEWLYQQGF